MAKKNDIWNAEELEKIESLRKKREDDNKKRRADIKSRDESAKAVDFKPSDKVHLVFPGWEDKRGVIVKSRKNEKDGIRVFDVKFGKLSIEGVPENRLRRALKIKADIEKWTDDLGTFIELTLKYQEIPTKNLLAMYKKNRFTKEGSVMKHELSKRGHVESKKEKNEEYKTVKWEEFLKQSKALSSR